MHVWFRRCLVIVALMFWQGGFTFYSGVVVPLGQETFGPMDQGFLTRQVTNYLNLSGMVAIPILGWDLWLSGDPSRWRRRLRWGFLILTALLLVGLMWLHVRMDGLLDIENMQLLDRRLFRINHRIYLWVSTVQWACCLSLTLLSIWSWRVEDGREVQTAASA